MRCAVLALLLTGCAYKPGAYEYAREPFAGQRVTVGCLDLAIVRRPDTPDGAVVEYQFGNRCDHASPVTLPIVATGRTPGGQERKLLAFDPNGEIVPLHIDGRSFGKETIEYRADDDYGVTQICVDVAAIVKQTPAQSICLAESR